MRSLENTFALIYSKICGMSTVKDVAKMYDALLSIKALSEPVKLGMQVSRRTIVFLALGMDQVLSSADPANLFKKIVSEDDQEKVRQFVKEALTKGELEEFYEKLKELGQG
jgi:hypothetical protein